jgi:hypothetical protein
MVDISLTFPTSALLLQCGIQLDERGHRRERIEPRLKRDVYIMH